MKLLQLLSRAHIGEVIATYRACIAYKEGSISGIM